ncbi:MAG TPA: VOC family protein [Candidatus Binataceae bacterium]|nr:VOC family protein [Candidatus Binataceae bacterium]
MPTRPLEFDGIDHAVLRVTDIQRSLKFYVDVLGLSLERIIEDVGIYQLRCGRNLIDLCALPAGAALGQGLQRGIDHLCLSVRGDMDAIVAYLAAHKVETASPVRELYGATGFGTSIYILDPDGYLLELKTNYSQYPVKVTAAQAMGSMTRPPAKTANRP